MKYNLSEELLEECLKQCMEEPATEPHWSLNCIPKIGFYRALHQFFPSYKHL